MVSRLEILRVWFRKKILLEVRKDKFRNFGNNGTSLKNRFLSFSQKLQETVLTLQMVREKKLYQSFENST